MKTNTSILLVAALLFLGGGCIPFNTVDGNGDMITQTISISEYDEIDASGSITINYSQSAEDTFLEVTTDRNIYDMYEFKVEDGHKLMILPKKEYRHNTRFRPTSFVINTHSSVLTHAKIAGDSEFNIDSALVTNELEIDFAGSGSIHLKDTVRAGEIKMDMAGSATANLTYIICDNFASKMAGSGNIYVAGTSKNADFKMAGSGEVHGFDFIVENMKGKIAGSGRIDIYATNSIDVKGAGSGDVNYKGNPQKVTSSIAGSGKLRAVD